MSNAKRKKTGDEKPTPPHDGYRIGGRGGKHADRGGKGGTSRTASSKDTSKHIGRPPKGKHAKD